jgi:hypothetical protein
MPPIRQTTRYVIRPAVGAPRLGKRPVQPGQTGREDRRESTAASTAHAPKAYEYWSAAQPGHHRRSEHRADTEVGVEDVQHGRGAVAEPGREQLVEAVVDAAEAEAAEEGGQQRERPVRGEREARAAAAIRP